MNLLANEQATHIEGITPVGSFVGTLEGSALNIESIILKKVKEACKENSQHFFISDLKVSIVSNGGMIDYEAQDNNSSRPVLSLGQPHASFSADVFCRCFLPLK